MLVANRSDEFGDCQDFWLDTRIGDVAADPAWCPGHCLDVETHTVVSACSCHFTGVHLRLLSELVHFG